MNQWLIVWVHGGWKNTVICADTLELALRKWRALYPDAPGVSLEKVECYK